MGFDDVFNTKTPEQVKEDIDNARKQAASFMPYFNIGKNESAVVRFLDDKAVTFYQHRVMDKTLKEGQGGYRMLTCVRQNCPLCAAGDRPRYVGAYRVVRLDCKVRDENGREVIQPEEQIFLKGINTLEVLDRKNAKKPLSSENMEIERIGDGFDTKYLFEFTGDKDPVSGYKKPDEDNLQEIFKPLPEVLQRLAPTIKTAGQANAGQPAPQPAAQSLAPVNDTAMEDGIPF